MNPRTILREGEHASNAAARLTSAVCNALAPPTNEPIRTTSKAAVARGNTLTRRSDLHYLTACVQAAVRNGARRTRAPD